MMSTSEKAEAIMLAIGKIRKIRKLKMLGMSNQ